MSNQPELQYTKEQIAQALESSYGVVTLAADKLKCSRQTVYVYIARYPSLKQHLNAGREHGIDVAETSLMSQIVKGDTAATIFYLKTQGRRRGYTERVETVNYNVDPALMQKAIELAEKRGISAADLFNSMIAELQDVDAATDSGDSSAADR